MQSICFFVTFILQMRTKELGGLLGAAAFGAPPISKQREV
jgi:hypothetical protein